jgi:hypothetical protein
MLRCDVLDPCDTSLNMREATITTPSAAAAAAAEAAEAEETPTTYSKAAQDNT